mmetsp:Transcript_78393/g.239796  ORF Transcript_78393/g.239796 Transcript_78393/m.239796 type:complete len:136 (-) Transcript_78393:115-522(-)
MALAMKTAKAAAAGKARAMKAKRESKIARGRMAKAMVLRGSKEKTVGGLRADGLMRNKANKVVSKRASAHGKRQFKNIESWVTSVVEARAALHVSGFVAVNGKTLQGKALYVKAKALQSRPGSASASAAAAPGGA